MAFDYLDCCYVDFDFDFDFGFEFDFGLDFVNGLVDLNCLQKVCDCYDFHHLF